MPQSGNTLDLMAPLMRRKNLLSKLSAQMQKYQQSTGGYRGGIGASSRALASGPAGLRSVMGVAGSQSGRAVAPGLSNLPAQALPNVDLSNIPSGFLPPTRGGENPVAGQGQQLPVDDGGGQPAPAEAPAASIAPAAPSPYSNWQEQGFVSQQAMQEFYSLPEQEQIRLLDNYVTRRRFVAV